MRLCTMLAAMATVAAAQSSGPPTCFSFNTNIGSGIQSLPIVAGGELFIGFTASQSVAIEQIDLYSASLPAGTGLAIEVFQDNGGSLGALLGAGAAVQPYVAWIATPLASPVALTAGGAYVLRMTMATGFVYVNGDATLPSPLPYLLNCGPNPPFLFPPCASIPITGTHATRLRFRANACGPMPFANATQVGSGCSGPFGQSPGVLLPAGPPILGTPFFTLFVNSFFGGGPIHIYWAAGPATAGVPLGFGGCTAYLDLLSLQALSSAGLEPLFNFPVTGITNSVTTSIPLDPLLAGVQITLQAVQFTPAGHVTPVGTLVVTNALELTLGY